MAVAPGGDSEPVVSPSQRLLKGNPRLDLFDPGPVLRSLRFGQIVAFRNKLNDSLSFAFSREISVETVGEYSKEVRIEIGNVYSSQFIHRPQRGKQSLFPTSARNALRIGGKAWRCRYLACYGRQSSSPQTTRGLQEP